MSYGGNGLSFRTLREAILQRLPEFRNGKGKLSHSEPDGSDWSRTDWACAFGGELGELAEAFLEAVAHAGAAMNLAKKVRREDFTPEEAKRAIADELADVICYLDTFAYHFGIEVDKAIEHKFNEVSQRVGSRVYLDGDDWHLRS